MKANNVTRKTRTSPSEYDYLCFGHQAEGLFSLLGFIGYQLKFYYTSNLAIINLKAYQLGNNIYSILELSRNLSIRLTRYKYHD